MSGFPQKINNSYESGSSSSSTSSLNEPGLDKSMQLEDTDGNKLANLMLPASTELYNTSAEEGIFPNVRDEHQSIEVPSYHREYEYNIEYSDGPLVYSWLPIVPGFTQDGYDNLQDFQYLEKLPRDDLLNLSDTSPESKSIPNQNVKYHEFLVINNSDPQPLDRKPTAVTYNELENSCNAMDLNISCAESVNIDPDLSFNGKILELKARDEQAIEQASTSKQVEETEEQRLLNESYELLKKEDSSRMILINEKSPELFTSNAEDGQSDSEDSDDAIEDYALKQDDAKPSDDCDTSIFQKIRSSLIGICPPPSVTNAHMSLSEMLLSYNNNKENTHKESSVKSDSLFLPSHLPDDVVTMEWPGMLSTKCLDVTYNKSDACEQIEGLFLRYVERYIGAETSSSFNHKIGPSSAAKRRIEKSKTMGQSPGRRLSHLANRRKIFSSANLKSSSLSTSHSSVFMIDKKKLYSKTSKIMKSPKKRTSAKKKTPGKKKTPKSAKRQLVTNPETARVSSKRALFTSPLETRNFSKLSLPKDVPSRLPRRSLFSPENNKRRRSTSPDHDTENRCGKQRRIASPTKLAKSQSFSIASTSASSAVNESFRKRLFCRTQSEIFPQLSSTQSSSAPCLNLGFKDPLNDTVKRKILWAVSNALTSKQISNEHENFKQFASTLAKLVKKILLEFYNPAGKSLSGQMLKFATHMVYYVVNGRPAEEIFAMTKASLQSKNTTKVTGYIGQQDFEQSQKNHVRRSSSFNMMASQSCSSLNYSQQSETSFEGSSLHLNESNSSINRSSSKNNEMLALRENFMIQSSEKSARKFGSESNLNKAKSSSSSSLMKAKRQISF